MPRPKKCRRVCELPHIQKFVPVCNEIDENQCNIQISIDEYETIRLIDYEQFTQEECAMQMNVARTTVTSIYSEARRKIADAIIHGKVITFEGGDYRLCDLGEHCCRKCGKDCDGCKHMCSKKEREL